MHLVLVSRNALQWAAMQWGDLPARDGGLVTPGATDQAVLLVLADLMNHRTHQCHPSLNYLTARLQLSKNRVRAAIRMWEEAGLVERSRRKGERGRQTSNHYQLRLDRGRQSPRLVSAHPVDKVVDKSVEADPAGVHQVNGGGFTTCTPQGRSRGSPGAPLEPSEPSNKEGRETHTPAPAPCGQPLKASPAETHANAPDGAKRFGHGSESASTRDAARATFRAARELLKNGI